ncbi:hypothetical protein AAG906_006720 [Vitis piasezkii]
MSMVAEEPGLIQIFSDGSVKRPERETSLPQKIHHPLDTSPRMIIVPDTPASSSLLPVLVYFHGGGFCIGTATWLGYHTFLGDFAVAAQSIVLSVDYRLAPEHRLPTAYDDCYCSLEWLSKQVSSEPWLQRADLSRVFLSGDSAGGNIAHNIAIRAIQKGWDSAGGNIVHNVALRTIQEQSCDQVKIKGLLIIHPFFGSEERIEKERASGEAENLALTDWMWKLSLPEGSNRDHYWCNYEMAKLSRAEWCRFPPAVVYVAGLDFLKERGVMYAAFLEKNGVEVKLVEAEGEKHVYHMVHPESEATRLLQKQMSEFIHNF